MTRNPPTPDEMGDGEWLAIVKPIRWTPGDQLDRDPPDGRPRTPTDGTSAPAATSQPIPSPDTPDDTSPIDGDARPAVEPATRDEPPGAVFDWRSDAGGSVEEMRRSTASSGDVRQRTHGDAPSSPAQQVPDDGDDADGDPGDDRKRRSRWVWLVIGVAVIATAAGVAWVVTDDGSTGTADETTGPVATAEVARETISATQEWGGTLGHGDPFTVTAAAPGTITGVAERDAPVQRGTELYRVDERPVTAMFGEVPMYRELQNGDTGADVRQLEENLSQMGYEGFDVDDEFTSATADAVRAWQEDLGVEETGVVTPADIVFVPQGRRIDTIHASVGEHVQPGVPVLGITSSDQIVSFEVEVRDRSLVEVGTEVDIRLPGGDVVAGTVSAADVVQVSAQGDEAGSDDTITEVEVILDDEADESLLGSPVDVVIEIDRREDVLVVPVNALVARSDGGHGLEVVASDGTTSIVEVETGLFAHGRVEVSGGGIDVGTVVGVAGR